MNCHDRNYFSDSRVLAGVTPNFLENLDLKAMTADLRIYDPTPEVIILDPDFGEDQDSAIVTVPLKFEVCSTCKGTGSHVNPSIDAGGLTAEDFQEDPDFMEDYISGVYDVTCYGCEGRNVVPTVDREKTHKAVLKALDAQESEYYAMLQIELSERRMGA